jgi:hypothetical protein
VKRTRPQSSLLFNTMFNLHKFMAFENRDPFALRAEQLGEEGQVLSDWDRFARGEYLRLAVEEEPDDMQVRVELRGGGGGGAWQAGLCVAAGLGWCCGLPGRSCMLDVVALQPT